VGLGYGEREGGERAHGGEEGPHHLAARFSADALLKPLE
jgi:hypothetical protein